MVSRSFHSFTLSFLIALVAIGNPANAQAPLPSCTELGVSSQFDCSTQCTNKGTTLQTFRGVNGANECTCAAAKLCNDEPSCADLLIQPGSAQVQCRAICPSGSTVNAQDYARFAGDTSNANIDQTHLVVSCACSGDVKCSDNILFSDRVNLKECADVGITSQASCQAKCNSYGTIFVGYDYDSRYNGEESVCSCTGSGGSPVAPYCADLDRRAAAGLNSAGMTVHVATAAVMSCLVMFVMI